MHYSRKVREWRQRHPHGKRGRLSFRPVYHRERALGLSRLSALLYALTMWWIRWL